MPSVIPTVSDHERPIIPSGHPHLRLVESPAPVDEDPVWAQLEAFFSRGMVATPEKKGCQHVTTLPVFCAPAVLRTSRGGHGWRR